MMGVQVVNVNYEEGCTMMGTSEIAKYVVKFVMGEWMVEQEGRVVWEPGMFIEFLMAHALINN